MTDLRLLLYVSSASHLFDTQELDALLAKSRQFNRSVGVTGILLYHDGNFVQSLEGAPEAVDHVYARVAADSRHNGIIRMVDTATDERRFSQWSMGFHRPEKTAPPAGWNDFLSGQRAGQPQGDIALSILESFRNHLSGL